MHAAACIDDANAYDVQFNHLFTPPQSPATHATRYTHVIFLLGDSLPNNSPIRRCARMAMAETCNLHMQKRSFEPRGRRTQASACTTASEERKHLPLDSYPCTKQYDPVSAIERKAEMRETCLVWGPVMEDAPFPAIGDAGLFGKEICGSETSRIRSDSSPDIMIYWLSGVQRVMVSDGLLPPEKFNYYKEWPRDQNKERNRSRHVLAYLHFPIHLYCLSCERNLALFLRLLRVLLAGRLRHNPAYYYSHCLKLAKSCNDLILENSCLAFYLTCPAIHRAQISQGHLYSKLRPQLDGELELELPTTSFQSLGLKPISQGVNTSAAMQPLWFPYPLHSMFFRIVPTSLAQLWRVGGSSYIFPASMLEADTHPVLESIGYYRNLARFCTWIEKVAEGKQGAWTEAR
ncbi:uncharacterized protein BDR25DRAFT_355804 [Lindgomyces ingoldianus]|uniref:Uncharacterized protein n=1 Tax=Lindgomyces ingoldianus TaxID=673940 RepID=A0ACB6QSV9_9PLEO|nr:uncharacterized protein BDR25DRAFT_355804 [Lindgomyces ingoldianus]KAF2470094.1 hypothetical protein BDR25DRAFT_355804 [Lindgomyces ingoldianus]